ncbi:coenzyme F420 hydrogenase%2C subunit gamma [uncultured Butyricicoccus sp.]|nr:coenzyme F420 hydrogenase%2C subunit gamma [uncultured Butyricicoccus sp.]
MKRRIIEIDQDKCNGCGACAAACHEGAIAMVDGKARLMRDDYCGGLELAAKKALQQSGKFIPWQVVTVTVDGRLVEE